MNRPELTTVPPIGQFHLRWRGCSANAITACLAGALTLVSLSARGSATYFVTNCNDVGTGSLRTAISLATSGDTINLAQLPLTCSKVTLSGELAVPQNDLIVLGPGASKILIDANKNGRVINHTGTGTLAIYDVSFANGYEYSIGSNAEGGCIRSNGSLTIARTSIDGCSAESYNAFGHGGALFAAASTKVYYSTITNGYAFSFNAGAAGGGIYVSGSGSLALYGSTISANKALIRSGAPNGGKGGGISLYGATAGQIIGSTISGNNASTFGGGIFACCSFNLAVTNSTVSGNVAGSNGVAGVVGGIESETSMVLTNSTVVFNRADAGFTFGSGNTKLYLAPGLDVLGSGPGKTVTVQSSLIANNTYSGTENDFSFDTVGVNPVTLSASSSHDLIRVSRNGLPAGTLVGVCPLLGPLRNNGGPTPTHALLSGSPGIDAGSNPYNFTNDQRGPDYASIAVYPRTSGAAPDVGAYEVQQSDIIFNTGFDGCIAL